jgi:hypothetical protein
MARNQAVPRFAAFFGEGKLGPQLINNPFRNLTLYNEAIGRLRS